VTGDALFCQRELCAQIRAQGGDYFFAVKANQPSLREDVATLFAAPPWDETQPANLRVNRGHGREELRLLRCSTGLTGCTAWPGLGMVCTVQRVVTRAGTTSYDQAYAVTSLRPRRRSAALCQALWRGHWRIENGLHYVRDVTFGEDQCQVRTGNGPQALAALRNGVIGILRQAGHTNLAAALRTYAGRPRQALALMGIAL